MRITIEPTKFSAESNMRTIIESHSDDLDLHTVMTDLIAPALIGWGFHPGSVYEYIEESVFTGTTDKEDVVDAYNYSVHPLDRNKTNASPFDKVKPFNDSWKDEIYNNSLDKNNWPE